MADRRDDRSSEEIRRDIEGARAEMHETVDALERKLSVGQLLDEVWGRFGGRGLAGSAASSMGDVIRDHPVPLALMGLGVAWLAVDRATGSDHDVGPGTYGRAEGRVGPYRGDAVDADGSSKLETVKDRGGEVAETARSGVSGAVDEVKDWAKRGRESARSAASSAAGSGADVRDRAGEAADRARGEVRHRARQAKRGFWNAMDEQPLALGAVAFGLGLAGGLSAPTTRWEDEAMGEASEAVKGEAKTMARSVAEDAKDVARDTAEAAREEADRQDLVGDLKEAGKRIGEKAKATAAERSREENLHPQGMKERASDASDRAQDQAKG